MNRLNRAGWLAVVVVGLVAISTAVVGGRAIWSRLRGLEGLAPVAHTPAPAINRVHTPSRPAKPTHEIVTPLAITPEPTPPGWARRIDDFTGNDYLAPPPEVERRVRAAFDAVLAVEVIADRSDAEALAYDRQAALEKVEALAAPEIVAHFQSRAQREILLAELGPENPVRCDNFARCTVGRVQVEPARTAIVYDAALCQQIVAYWADAPVSADGARCIALSADDAPPTIYAGVVERCADGVWRVVAWQPELVR